MTRYLLPPGPDGGLGLQEGPSGRRASPSKARASGQPPTRAEITDWTVHSSLQRPARTTRRGQSELERGCLRSCALHAACGSSSLRPCSRRDEPPPSVLSRTTDRVPAGSFRPFRVHPTSAPAPACEVRAALAHAWGHRPGGSRQPNPRPAGSELWPEPLPSASRAQDLLPLARCLVPWLRMPPPPPLVPLHCCLPQPCGRACSAVRGVRVRPGRNPRAPRRSPPALPAH